MKKLLLSLFGIIGLGFICFTNAGSYTYSGTIKSTNSSQNVLIQLPIPIIENISHSFSVSCSFSNYTQLSNTYVLRISNTYLSNEGRLNQVNTQLSNAYNFGDTITYSSPNSRNYVYFSFVLGSIVSNVSYDYVCTINGDNIINQVGGGTSDCSSVESDLATCQSDLINCGSSLNTCQGMYERLETDYDLLEGNYNICTSELSTCLNNGGSSGSGTINWSSLYINNNQVLGNQNIFVNIPSEYQYSYNSEGENSIIEVIGLVQDTEYLSGVINKLNYIPTTEDLSNVFSNLGLFGSLLVVCLFVILVFYMIKKIFD